MHSTISPAIEALLPPPAGRLPAFNSSCGRTRLLLDSAFHGLQERIMAKGAMKAKKEARKPKKDAKKPAAATKTAAPPVQAIRIKEK
jgi:hypothetical protein